MQIEKQVPLAEVTHKDIGKQVSFKCEIANVIAEFLGTLAGIDRLKVTLKDAKFRKTSDMPWAATAAKNPELEVTENTVITLYRNEI